MTSEPGRPAEPADQRLGPLFIGIVLVELLAIAGLYWLGVHFR